MIRRLEVGVAGIDSVMQWSPDALLSSVTYWLSSSCLLPDLRIAAAALVKKDEGIQNVPRVVLFCFVFP